MNEAETESDEENSIDAEKPPRSDPLAEVHPFVGFSIFSAGWQFSHDFFLQSLEWIFGFNAAVPLINLTTEASLWAFATASAQAFQVFRCDGTETRSFVGHVSDWNSEIVSPCCTFRFRFEGARHICFGNGRNRSLRRVG